MNHALNRLAFVLIALLAFLILVSAIIPQRDLAEDQVLDWKSLLGDNYAVIETLGLDRIYFTPFFFLVVGLLGLTLAVGNVWRFRTAYRIEKTLLKARHIGSIIFHLSLLLIIAAIILNYLFKFDGVFALTEGQLVDDVQSSYFRLFEGPARDARFSRFQLRLDRVHDTCRVGDAIGEAAEITLLTGSASSHLNDTVRTNRPLKWKDLEFHFGLKTGYSPEILVSDSAGRMLVRGFVRLATQKIEGERIFADYIHIPDGNLKIELKVLPGDSAAYLITVSQDDSALYNGQLSGSDTARFEGFQLTIPRLRRWCYIDVIESPFLNLVFFGFWTGLAGLSVTLIPRVIGRKQREDV